MSRRLVPMPKRGTQDDVQCKRLGMGVHHRDLDRSLDNGIRHGFYNDEVPPIVGASSSLAPRLHAMVPFGWPPKNYDIMALIGTACLMGVLWPYRYAVLFAGAVYFLGRGWFWIGRNYPMVMWLMYGLARGLFR